MLPMALDPVSVSIVVGALAISGVGGLLYAAFAGRFAAEARRSKRLASIDFQRNRASAAAGVKSRIQAKAQTDAQKRIKELADKEKAKKRKLFDIKARMMQAGLSMPPAQFILIFVVLGGAGFVGTLLVQQPIWIALAAGVSIAVGGPRFALSYKIESRRKKFIAHLPNAIDILIRGVRSGLPINEGLKVIAAEIPDPVKTEFQYLVDTTSVGVPLEDALARMYERMPTPEVNFFRTVLIIQKQTGGNLSDALANLSQILRDRKKLKQKIVALSSEARSSAIIIGSLPFLVAVGVYVVSPDYIQVLFVDERGNFMLGGALVWMSMGILVMRQMINFEI